MNNAAAAVASNNSPALGARDAVAAFLAGAQRVRVVDLLTAEIVRDELSLFGENADTTAILVEGDFVAIDLV